MSNDGHPIGFEPKLLPQQPQLGQGNSSQLVSIPSTSYAPLSSSSSSSSSKRSSSSSSKHHEYDDSLIHGTISFGSMDGSLNENDDNECIENDAASSMYVDEPKQTPFNLQWVFSEDFALYHTPSRKDEISYNQELALRRRGTAFIRQIVTNLKLKPICKETAYIYFHRFFQIRSFKLHDPHRIATACLYLACKYEDHPNYKDHLVRITHLLLFRKDLNKSDKEYVDSCDRLIRDENLLLQVLGFASLGIVHFQVLIVESSQHPIVGTSKELYTSAYKISSEINRLTMLCVEFSSPILACVSIYLASVYQGIILPNGWTSSVKGATAQDMDIVVRIGDQHKERIAQDSELVKGILSASGVKCPMPSENVHCSSAAGNSRGSTPVYTRNDISQQILSTFSPDSAYSSNSSHSPPENASNFSSQFRGSTKASHSNGTMMNYGHPIHPSKSSKSSKQYPVAASYSPTATSVSTCYSNSANSHDTVGVSKYISGRANVGGLRPMAPASNNILPMKNSGQDHSVTFGAAGQLNTHASSLLKPVSGAAKKRAIPYLAAATLNLNHVNFANVSDMTRTSRNAMTSEASGESYRKRLKNDHHFGGKHHHQPQPGHMSGAKFSHGSSIRSTGHRTSSSSNTNEALLKLGSANQQQHHSMPYF